MKLQLLFVFLLVALAGVFANPGAPAAAAPAKFDLEGHAAFKKLSASVAAASEDTTSKVKSLVADIAALKKSVEALTAENAALKAALAKQDQGVNVVARVTKLDELVNAIGAQVDELKAIVAKSTLANQVADLVATTKATVITKSNLYYAQASAFAQKNAGPAFADFKVKATALALQARDRAVELFKQARQRATDELIARKIGPADKAPLIALSVLSLAVFIIAIVALSVLLAVLRLVKAIICAVCCCRCGKKAAKKTAAAPAAGVKSPSKAK